MSHTILSVDSGLTGALAWLRRDPDGAIHLLGVQDMPTAKAKQGKTLKSHVQPAVLAQVIRSPIFGLPDLAVVKDVHAMPGQGVASIFRFGFVAGLIQGVLAALDVPTHTVRTNEWQRRAGVKTGPDAGRLRATQLFPRQAMLFARKMDHNRADAALIGCSFAREFF